jgi:hypothetical protein
MPWPDLPWRAWDLSPDENPAVGNLFPFIEAVVLIPTVETAAAGTKADEKALAMDEDSLEIESMNVAVMGLEAEPWKV